MELLRATCRRPTLWVELGVACAWVALVAGHLLLPSATGSPGGVSWAPQPLWVCFTDVRAAAHGAVAGGGGGSAQGALLAGLPMWAAMATAMMLPAAMPAVRHVTVNSIYWRRRRATLEFLLGYVGLWLAFTAAILGLLAPRLPEDSAVLFAALLGLAALWQLTPLKERALRACHEPTPLPPSGWRATVGAARFGLRNGGACVASCWALMLTMVVASGAGASGLAWMVLITGIVTAEKLSLKPRRAAWRNAALLAAFAAGALAVALFAQPAELPSLTS